MNTDCTRELQLDTVRADAKQRRVPAVISSETPVKRDGYMEVLRHDAASIDLSRAPLPLIESHDGSRLNIGLVDNLRIASGKLRGDVVLGRSARAAELWPDIEAGVVRNLSVGYQIHAHRDRSTEETTIYEVTRWTPFEVSLVAVPADPAAGTYRSFPMNEIESQAADEAGERLSRSQRRAQHAPSPAELATTAERERVAEIQACARALETHEGMRALGDKAIEEGWSPERFRHAALQLVGNKPTEIYAVGREGGVGTFVGYRYGPGGATPMGSEARMLGARSRQYSIVRALRSMIDPHDVDAGFEREVSQEIAHQSGRKPRGMYFPMGEMQKRDLTVGGAPSLVGTQHLAESFIDALRVRSVVLQLNPTLLSGLVGNVEIPRLATASTAYWIAGDGADSVTASTPAFDKVTLSPKTVGALVTLSRKMILQGEPAAEDVVRNDLAQVIATALDAAAIQGTGASNQPTGIVNTSGVSTDTFAAATPTFAEIVAMESTLTGANVDAARAVYLTTPALAGTLKTTQKASTGNEMIWQAGNDPGVGLMNGLRAVASSNVPSGKVILANLADLVIGMWGGIDLEVNPYADFAKGSVSVRCFASVDMNVRHAKSFAVYSTP